MSQSAEETRVAPEAWRTLSVLFLVYMFHYVDRSVFSIVLEPIKQEFSLSDSQLGLVTGGVYALTYALAGVPLGILVDRVNRKHLLSGLLAIWSGATVVCGLAQSYLQLVLARFAVGAAEAGGAPASMSMIGDLFPRARRATALGIFWMSPALAAAVTFIVGGYIAQTMGWRAAFFIAGFPGLVLALVLLLAVREPKRGAMDAAEPDAEAPPSVVEAVRTALRQPLFLPVFVAMTLNAIVGSGMLVWIASFLVRTQDLNIRDAGLIAGLAAATCGTLGAFLGGYLGDRIARNDMSRLALLAAGTSVLAAFAGLGLAAAPTVLAAVIGFAAFELTYRTYMGPGYALLLSPLPSRTRGVASSAMQVSSNLVGWGLGPLIVGAMSDAFAGQQSLRAGVAALVLVNILAAVAYVVAWFSARKGRDAQPAPAAV